MADECDVSKIVTTFLLNTCRLPPLLRNRYVQAVMYCGTMAADHPVNDEEAEYIPLITGSVAEFYIEPMLPHLGDIDLMFHRNTRLAIPRGHPPPTQLPDEFHKYVQLFEIIDSHLPGYVYLQLRYFLTQYNDNSKYTYTEYDGRPYLTNEQYTYEDNERHSHGPAALTIASSSDALLSLDLVPCVRCLSWPTQAADWPSRHRNYGWPDSATFDRVVSNGCDLVRVAHRQCRQHEVMGNIQWRLSFSRAEIVLINSWMPVQQITYHILRVYLKTERLTESADNSEPAIMSNYHIKTLMLWACELKPRSWWIDNLNLVRICVELLQTLSVWLTDTRCPHYFINNCNLLDNSLSDGAVASKSTSIDETYLSTWLINNYVRKCALLCPSYILRLFENVTTTLELQNAVLQIVGWRLNTSLLDMWLAVDFAVFYIPVSAPVAPMYSLNSRSCAYWMSGLAKINNCFCVYFAAVALLHARKISENGFDDKLMDIVAILFGRNFSQRCSVSSLHKTELNTSELVEFLQKSAVEHLTTYRQSVARDFGSVATIVTTDFEAMYAYKRGDYQRFYTQNVHTLLDAVRMPNILMLPECIQLLDDDIVSLIALMLMVRPEYRVRSEYSVHRENSAFTSITQLTLSLYLMTQCQLKLHHSVTSLTLTLHFVNVAQRKHPTEALLNQLTLKLTARKANLAILHRL